MIRYTPATNFSGTDTFTYVAGDGLGNTATATVTVTVGAVNQKPVINFGSITQLTTNENTPIVLLTKRMATLADFLGRSDSMAGIMKP